MNTTRSILFLAAVTSFAVAGCKKDDKKADDKSGGTTAGKSGDKKDPAPAKDGPVEIGALGLVFDGPGGAEVSELMGDQMVQAPGLVFSVGVVEEPLTLEKAVEEADLYTPTFSKKEALPDGYHLEFTNEGAAGKNYWVEIQRKIGDKTFKCSTMAGEQSFATAATKACLSLRAK